MDLDLERIAFGTVVGVTGATVAPGTCRERNHKINFGKKFDEIAGPNGARFHKVLMCVARMPVHNLIETTAPPSSRTRNRVRARAGKQCNRGTVCDALGQGYRDLLVESPQAWLRNAAGFLEQISPPGSGWELLLSCDVIWLKT